MIQFGKAVTIIATAAARELCFHDDIAAFGAPAECHRDVERGEARRMRQAYRHARSVSGFTRSKFNRKMREVHPRHPDRAIGIIAHKMQPWRY